MKRLPEPPKPRTRARLQAAVFFIYALIGVGLLLPMRGLRLDDPFITYRYAEHLAAEQGFVFNPGERTLITTAPLYALLLALLRRSGADVPTASVVVGACSLVAAAWGLFTLGLRRGQARAGFLAGVGLLAFPLMWLTVGFETPLFVAVALLLFLALDVERYALAGLCAGVAVGLRGDGLVVLGLALLLVLVSQSDHVGRNVGRFVVTALLAYAPLGLWLTVLFGSPVPSTLLTKFAQAASGLTGFYPHTTFPEGALILTRAYLSQSPLFGWVLLAASMGLMRLIASFASPGGLPLAWAAFADRLKRGLDGYGIVAAWMFAHLIGYSLIGVAPYAWYYAPLAPGLMGLAALGMDWAVNGLTAKARIPAVFKRALPFLGGALLLWPLAVGDLEIIKILVGGTPPPPTEITAKVLPETKVDIYERAGRWLNTHTPPTATVGMTELGVMSYYANRRAVDFLGLTQPAHLDAIRRGDYLQALVREQPDYLALTHINALYDVEPQRAAWFTALYAPVASFDDPRFWGAPVTVWKRTRAPLTEFVMLDEGAHDLGDGWQVTGLSASARDIVGGAPLVVRVRLRAGKPVGDRDLRVQPVALTGDEGLPVGSRLIHTRLWRTGEEGWVDVPLLPPSDPRPGGYVVTVKWLDGDATVAAGKLKAPLNAHANPEAVVAPLSGGVGVEVLSQPIMFCVGATMTVTLVWRGGDVGNVDYTAFVHLRDAANTIVAQTDAPPLDGAYPTSVWSPGEVIPDPHRLSIGEAVPSGRYALIVGLYNPTDDARWPVDKSPYRTLDGGVKIGEVAVGPCP